MNEYYYFKCAAVNYYDIFLVTGDGNVNLKGKGKIEMFRSSATRCYCFPDSETGFPLHAQLCPDSSLTSSLKP